MSGFDFGLSAEDEERARRLHEAAIVFDGQAGVGEYILSEEGTPEIFERLRVSGLTGYLATLGAFGERAWTWENAVRDAAFWGWNFHLNRERLVHVRRPDDLDLAHRTGRVGVVLGLQNADHLDGRIDRLDLLYGLGVRALQPTYNHRNLLGDGCLERHDVGLTRFGVEVIERCNDRGIFLNLSHCGRRTTLEAIEASDRPVALTHVGARALHDHPRNKSDEELVLCAARGGLIGIIAVPFFIANDPDPTIEIVLDHLDHVARLVGTEHVAIGTDRPDLDPNESSRERWQKWWQDHSIFDLDDRLAIRWPPYCRGLEYLTDWPNVARGLVARGYADPEIEGMLGGNFRRFLGQTIR